MEPTDYTPVPKVAATGIAAAFTVLVVFALGLAGVDVPVEVATSFTAVIAFAAGYIKKA